jgi:hypothetical protein
MSDPNVKIGLTQSAGLAARYQQHRIARRVGDEQEQHPLAPPEPGRSPFRLSSPDLTPAAGSRSSRREDNVEADPRPGMVPGIAAVGRGRARGLTLEVPHLWGSRTRPPVLTWASMRPAHTR